MDPSLSSSKIYFFHCIETPVALSSSFGGKNWRILRKFKSIWRNFYSLLFSGRIIIAHIINININIIFKAKKILIFDSIYAIDHQLLLPTLKLHLFLPLARKNFITLKVNVTHSSISIELAKNPFKKLWNRRQSFNNNSQTTFNWYLSDVT